MKPSTLLVVLDGWGHRAETSFNAIHHANTPTWDTLWQNCPTSILECSGESVGLPDGQMGNSEVGHMTLGAGRIVYQDLTRIDRSIANGEFETNGVVQSLLHTTLDNTLHILGLLSPGGVHSHENHIFKMLELSGQAHRSVAFHAFLDGRDTPPQSASDSLQRATVLTDEYPDLDLASISGRYFAMDRDRRWDRTRLIYDLLTLREAGLGETDAQIALQNAYDRGETDEFVRPTRIGAPRPILDGDEVLFMNFRADRARQLSQALALDSFIDGFKRTKRPKLRKFVSLTPYSEELSAGAGLQVNTETIFQTENLVDTLGETLAKAGKTQLRIAETEKYAHVTYFFSGGTESTQPGEDQCLLPSPKVATYDLKPEMSAHQVTQGIVEAMEAGTYDVIVSNLANADMVGHTGNFSASIKAVEYLDVCLGRIKDTVERTGSQCLITADHGNVEQLQQNNIEQPHTAHTLSAVPLVYLGPKEVELNKAGGLQDVAPTMLELLSLKQPAAMTGLSLLL